MIDDRAAGMDRSNKTHHRLLAACLIVSLAACGRGETPNEPPAAEEPTSAAVAPAPSDEAAAPQAPVAVEPSAPVETTAAPESKPAPPVVAEAPPVKAAPVPAPAPAPAAPPPPPEKPAAFAACASCHSVESGGRNGIGPNLFGVMGRSVGGKAGYAYSDAMAAHGGTWTPALMDEFLAAPREIVPGTKMMAAPVRNAEARQALVAYLSSLR